MNILICFVLLKAKIFGYDINTYSFKYMEWNKCQNTALQLSSFQVSENMANMFVHSIANSF